MLRVSVGVRRAKRVPHAKPNPSPHQRPRCWHVCRTSAERRSECRRRGRRTPAPPRVRVRRRQPQPPGCAWSRRTGLPSREGHWRRQPRAPHRTPRTGPRGCWSGRQPEVRLQGPRAVSACAVGCILPVVVDRPARRRVDDRPARRAAATDQPPCTRPDAPRTSRSRLPRRGESADPGAHVGPVRAAGDGHRSHPRQPRRERRSRPLDPVGHVAREVEPSSSSAV